MATRTITGTLYHPNTNTPWAGGRVVFLTLAPFTDGMLTYPQDYAVITADAAGAFTTTIGVPDSGATAAYHIVLPDGSIYTVHIAVGPAVDLAVLVNTPSANIPASAIQSAIDAFTATGPIVGLTRTTADRTGVADAAAQLRADLATAIAAGHKRLYLPAGTYQIALTSGNLFDITTDDVEIFGDGIGKTILLLPAGTVLLNHVRFAHTTARHTHIHHLTMQGGVGVSAAGDFTMIGVACDTGCFHPALHDLEGVGFFGGGAAGGTPYSFYQTWTIRCAVPGLIDTLP